MDTRTQIGVFPPGMFSAHRQVFEALGTVFPVDFRAVAEGAPHTCSAVVEIGTPAHPGTAGVAEGVRHMLVYGGPADLQSAGPTGVQFGDSERLPGCLRGRNLPGQVPPLSRQLSGARAGEVLATAGDSVVWRRTESGGTITDVVSAEFPTLTPEQLLFEWCEGENFFAVAPLLILLRELCAAAGWQPPPVRACLMFDDPNLHWTSYGFVRYAEVARRAARDGFHVSFATVPLDSWYVNGPCRDLFRREDRWLSLLFHGNNHTQEELGMVQDETAALEVAAQAMRRINVLTSRHGVPVSSVMAAPHSACSLPMLKAMARVGFEAACISRWSLRYYNPDFPWRRSLGLELAEFIEGLPVIHRCRFRPNLELNVTLAVLFDIPVVLYGHHEDLRDAPDLLSTVAARVNSVGAVRWMNMETISRSNHRVWQSGTVAKVRLETRRARVVVPDACSEICFERPWVKAGPAGGADETVVIRRNGAMLFEGAAERISARCNVQPGEVLEFEARSRSAMDWRNVPNRHTGWWPIARRIAVEARDRMRGLL